jgi:hypothetical protein
LPEKVGPHKITSFSRGIRKDPVLCIIFLDIDSSVKDEVCLLIVFFPLKEEKMIVARA